MATSEVVPTPGIPAEAVEAVAAVKGGGRSYWDIVFAQFRKNRPGVASLFAIVLIYLVSVFTPWIANDRPIRFHGTMPGVYSQLYREYKAGAHGEFVRAPDELASAQKRWREKRVQFKEFKRAIRVEDWHAFGDAIDAAKEKFLIDNPADFKWKTDAVEVAAVRELLPPEAQAALDATVRRVEGELVDLHRERLDATLGAIEVKLRGLSLQLADEFADKAEAGIEAYQKVADDGWLTRPAEERKAIKTELDALRDRLAADFDPEKATLVPRTLWPAAAALTTLDVFLESASVMFFIVVPLLFVGLHIGRGRTRTQKVRLALWIVAVPVLVLTLWKASIPKIFETYSWKSGVRDGAVLPLSITNTPVYYGMNEQNTAIKFLKPSGEHWLGTDENGRDLLTRMLWGSRISLAVGFVSTGIALLIGVTVGALAGFYRGKVDVALRFVIELVLCFPSLFIILAVIAVLPPSIFNVMIVLGIFGWTTMARLTRGEFFRLVDQDFVTAGRALGASDFRLIARHLMPNSLGPVLVAASFSVASAILTESSLSFLGFGVVPPDTSWGAILATARENPSYYWMVLTPGFAIFLTVTLYNLLGEAIRDATDPRMRM